MGHNIEDLQAEIEQGVADLVAGEGWQRWLAVAARFPKYSFRNQLLILSQRPDARVVMGYRAWQALGHQVRRGEESISILAPCTYKAKVKQEKGNPDRDDAAADDGQADHDGDEEGKREDARRVLRGFRVAHVFDINQTDGDGVRPPERPALLEGEAPAGLWDKLAAQIHRAGYTLTRAESPNGANGATYFATQFVTVAPHLSPAQAAKTLAHELAHVTMHDGTEYAVGCRGQAEIEAESVAYILCHTAGLHAGVYSFGYVAHWSAGDTQNIRQTADRVVTTARILLERLGLLGLVPAPQPETIAA
jgi:antirestriction protein ArdC